MNVQKQIKSPIKSKILSTDYWNPRDIMIITADLECIDVSMKCIPHNRITVY